MVCRYILKVEWVIFGDRLKVGYEKRREIDFRDLGLDKWKCGVVIYGYGKDFVRNRFGGKCKSVILDLLNLRYLLYI